MQAIFCRDAPNHSRVHLSLTPVLQPAQISRLELIKHNTVAENMEKTEDSFNVLLKVSLQTKDTTWLLPPPSVHPHPGWQKATAGLRDWLFWG